MNGSRGSDRRTGQEVGLLAALMFLLRLLGPTNYGIFAIIVTALVVTLVALTGVDPNEVILARGAHTLLGGAIAMVAYRLWPTSQRIQAAEALAAMLDAYRDYFRAVRTAFEREDAGASTAIERTRAAGRVARTNLEAAVERLCTEPGSSEETIRSFSGMLASSHRLAHAMMALEAGLAASRPAPARPTFRRFADDVELTLYHAAAALRGSRMRRDELPDLREDHNALVETGAARERYALVNTETDRITNSLNTLVEQILALPIMSGRGNA